MSTDDATPAPPLPAFADVREVGDTRVIVNFDADLFCGSPAVDGDIVAEVLASGSLAGAAESLAGLYEAAPEEVREDLQRLMLELLTTS